MAGLKPTSRADLIRGLKAANFSDPKPQGGEWYMMKGTHKLHIPNPHGKDDIRVPLLRKILRQAGITPKEWLKLKK